QRGTPVAHFLLFNSNQKKKMRKLTQKMTKAWLLTLAVSILAGFGESNAAMDFDTIISKTEEFVKAASERSDEKAEKRKAFWQNVIFIQMK
ncbi:hypothetical protein N9Z32_09955, partial [Akkermansiaceae bacterium]|nr:hypothetical protein [Akkermansiaceae bacterium]